MRKNIIIAGIIILAIGGAMFFGGPYIFKSSVNLNQLLPFKNLVNIAAGSSVVLGVVPAGKILVAVYNDTLSKPVNISVSSGSLGSQNENGTFIVEYYNSGNGNQSVYMNDNYTEGVIVNYTSLTFSATGIIYSIFMVVVGIILMFAGGVIAVVGLILKPKNRN